MVGHQRSAAPVIAIVGDLLAWLLGRRQRVRVSGRSMEPTLVDGEFVLIDPTRRPEVGELVVSHHPVRSEDDLLIVKRVVGLDADSGVLLHSDNPSEGTDSRTWGPVDADLIVGTVTIVLDRLRADLTPPGTLGT